MAESRRITPAIWLAGGLTLLVSLTRLWAELAEWSILEPSASNPGGGAAWLGIVWLIPLCGLVFGRMLAARGDRPSTLR